MRPCPPWAEARSWPDETGESAVASHHPGSQTASSHMSFAPPWLPVLPPGPQKNHPAHAWSYWSSCGNTFPYHGSDGGRHWSSAGSRRPSSDALDKLLHGQRHQAALILWFHHVPAQVWIPLRANLVQTLHLPQDSDWRISGFSHAAINQPGEGASFCGETHSMILSWGLNGLRESRPSLLITCTRMKITLLSFSALKKRNGGKKAWWMNSNQPDLVLFVHDEESVPVDVEVSGVQKSLQRDQTHYLRANHWQFQVLNRHSAVSFL